MSEKMRRNVKRVTQKVVAEEAGVSQTLVSLVLSNGALPAQVAEGTRERILEVAERLGYSLRRMAGRQRSLALILPVVSRAEALGDSIYEGIEDFYARTQRYVAEAAYRKGYSLIVRPYEQSAELTHWLTEWEVDGVLWHASDENLLAWITKRLPTVQLHYGASLETDAVTANQHEIPVLALNHLYERGHRRICFLPGGSRSNKPARMRVAGFIERASSLGLPIFEEFLEGTAADSREWIEKCLRLLELPEDQRPTAFVCGDPLALTLARNVQERGFSIPGDLSLIGVDNLSAGALYNPPLTSIDVCNREVSDTAVALLVDRIADPTLRHQKVFISPSLVERGSVADLSRKEPSSARMAVN